MVVEINGKVANIPEEYVKSKTEKQFLAEMQAHQGWTREELSEVYRAVKGMDTKQEKETEE